MQRIKAVPAESASWKQREGALTSAVTKACSELAFLRFALLNESWKQEMRFDALCRNSSTCMIREDNYIFLRKRFPIMVMETAAWESDSTCCASNKHVHKALLIVSKRYCATSHKELPVANFAFLYTCVCFLYTCVCFLYTCVCFLYTCVCFLAFLCI